ncbi:S26 family signal peptidase [Amycolatopsis sp. NPDC021455]|uniref:S26 family signal peptidase n=1 Tax=Amycolatopsis sp. NPDC021455 TaxID=3154901 RepID=UPI0033FE1CCD
MTGWLWAAAAVVTGGVIRWQLRGRWFVAVVSGLSMTPALRDGQRVLCRRAGKIRRGVVVVVGHPGRDGPRATRTGYLIKRVAAVPGDPVPRAGLPALADRPEDRVPAGMLVLLGDAKGSIDSAELGYFPVERVIGVVTTRSVQQPNWE